MASKDGPRAAGTDGMDFLHRERVAPQYKSSVLNKNRFRITALIHSVLILIMLCRLSTSIFQMFNMKPPKFLKRYRLPKAEGWELMWLMSMVATLFGFLSLPKNTTIMLQQYVIGTVLFGFAPIVYAVYRKSFDLLAFIQTRESKKEVFGIPLVILWFMFFTAAIQVQGFGLYFASSLLKSWKKPVQKKNE